MKELVLALQQGLVVAAATESSFGLLADATNRRALDRLLAVKARGADKGIPVILPDEASWSLLVPEVPPGALALARAFWPGACSIALRAYPSLDPRLTLDGSVAVRLPGPSLAADLARACGRPLTATSANLPGEPPANSDSEVLAALAAAVERGDLVVAPGQSPGGAPSTLVMLEAERAHVVREGRVPLERVREVLARARVHLDEQGGDR